MEIVMLTGSPHKNGTTAQLAKQFTEGAQAAGHTVTCFDTALLAIAACRGCDVCRTQKQGCVMEDDFAAVKDALLRCDFLALVSPVYNYGITAQLKAAIDRLHAIIAQLKQKPRSAVVLTACGSRDTSATEPLIHHINAVLNNLGWHLSGSLSATGASDSQQLTSDHLKQAYQLGRDIPVL